MVLNLKHGKFIFDEPLCEIGKMFIVTSEDDIEYCCDHIVLEIMRLNTMQEYRQRKNASMAFMSLARAILEFVHPREHTE